MTVKTPVSKIKARPYGVTSYFDRTHWPLQSLIFLLPLLLIYEVGTVAYAPVGDARLPAIYAERLLGRFFELFGVTGYYLPGLLVTVVLLAMHITRGDPWRPEFKLHAGMWIESWLWALPLFVLGTLLAGQPVAAWMLSAPNVLAQATAINQTGLGAFSWQAGMVFAIGAGIYEELLFRLVAIALLDMLFSDLLALPARIGSVLAVVLSSLLFAAYHFSESNPFEWARFAFYMIAGLYFAVLYVGRGFGIVAATHALYDVMAIATHFR